MLTALAFCPVHPKQDTVTEIHVSEQEDEQPRLFHMEIFLQERESLSWSLL